MKCKPCGKVLHAKPKRNTIVLEKKYAKKLTNERVEEIDELYSFVERKKQSLLDNLSK